MKKFSNTILLSLLIGVISIAQEPFYKSFKWEQKEWNIPENDAPKTLLHVQEVIEFISEDDLFLEYYFLHKVEYINHDDEVEKNNKKYIPYYGTAQVVVAKARVIKPDQTVINLDDSDILESEDEETGRKSQFFALENLEKGDIIDMYYVLRKKPNYNGTYENIQSEYPLNEYEFSLFAPKFLGFAFELKNDTTRVNMDTTYAEKNHWYFKLNLVPALKYESQSPYGSLRKYVLYKLDKNLATGKGDLISYGVASQNIYRNIHENLGPKELKSLDKFLKKFKIDQNAPTDTIIRAVEDFIKSNVAVTDMNQDQFDNMTSIVSNRTASSFGMVKMFANTYSKLGIPYEIVLTSDRTRQYFDPDFESYHFLEQYLIYFPETKKYLCPDKYEYRYPLVPSEFTDNDGLFIQEVKIGDFKSGIGKIKHIEPLPYKSTHHNMDMKVTIEDDFSAVNFDLSQSSLGYYAYYIQSILNMVSEDVYNKIGENYLESLMEDLESDDWKFVNIGAENLQKKPLLFECKGKNEHLIEYAGEKYLFQVGKVIGPQVEMYSEDERKLPLHDDYKREFVRHIEVTIPEGYEVKNPDDLIIKSEYVNDGKQVLLFESNYKIEGQKLIIDINEFYDQLYFTVEEYPKYRDVVNSASDFNKVTLIIDKKE